MMFMAIGLVAFVVGHIGDRITEYDSLPELLFQLTKLAGMGMMLYSASVFLWHRMP